jgi:ribose-phosphate pyrophosphokinase
MILINGRQVTVGVFPNNETYIDMYQLSDEKVSILLKFDNNTDFIHLRFIKDYLDEKNIQADLTIPYLPYSRMDRKEEQRLFTLKSIAKFINEMNFKSVTIWEPHSEVSTALFDRIKVVNKTKELALKAMTDLANIPVSSPYEKILEGADTNNIFIVYPDAGAAKRYGKQIKYKKILECLKERDFNTGEIKSLKIQGPDNINCSTAIIVDDLCSRGGTFQLTAGALKEKYGISNIILVVTHCEDNIFNGEVLNGDLISKVYTTNSILTKRHDKLIVEDNF